jgi:hypothetical protein
VLREVQDPRLRVRERCLSVSSGDAELVASVPDREETLMTDLNETLAGMQARAAHGKEAKLARDLESLLSAVQNVLALCDDPYFVEFGSDAPPEDGVLVVDVRKALTDALERQR